MRLTDLPRTSGFRLALVFLALFGVAATILLSFLYIHTQQFFVARVDDWLQREAPATFRGAPEQMTQRIGERAARNANSGNVFMLLDPDGNRLAGTPRADRVAVPAFERPVDLRLGQDGGALVRGLALRLPDGRIVLLGQTMDELTEFNQDFVVLVLRGAGLTTLLGLLGALMVGLSTARRFDALTTAIERIVRGDLSGRLPAGSGSSDIDRLTHVVNRMLDDIERLMHEVKGVCDGIAHDLRTPLTRLLAGLERARRRPGDAADHEQALDEAIAKVRSILQTFSSLLRIAEVEDGARRSGFTSVDLRAIAADVVDFYDPLADAKNVSLTLAASEPEAPVLPGDASLLFEAIGNLVENGIKFTPQGGHVIVEVLRARARLILRVRDDGPGIGPSERDAVLRRFYRSETSRATEGNGLGLSLVAAVARLHRFTMLIEDAGPGCCITLTAEQP